LTARELQILDHLEQAQNLDTPLTEYAAAYNLDVKDLYAGKAQLVKKGLLPGRAVTPERAGSMKGKRFTEEQITYALRQAEGGTPVAEVCRQLGVSEASFYLWKKVIAPSGYGVDG
jgi:hypothetical protein